MSLSSPLLSRVYFSAHATWNCLTAVHVELPPRSGHCRFLGNDRSHSKTPGCWCWKTHPVLGQYLCKGQNRWSTVRAGYSASSWNPLRANLLAGLPQDGGNPALPTGGQCWVGTVTKFLNRQQPTHSSSAFSVRSSSRFGCGDTGTIHLTAPDFAHDSAESHLSI